MKKSIIFLISFLWFSPLVFFSGCSVDGLKFNKKQEQLLTRDQVIEKVRQRPDSLSRTISLAIIKHPNTRYRIDHHNYPAWTWRDEAGDNGYGGCVHIHPVTGEPYLETQFPKSERPQQPLSPKGIRPSKYIQYNLTGPWHARWHVMWPIEAEENWSDNKADKDGQRLLDHLAKRIR